MGKIADKLMIVFFGAWLLCGCSIDQALDDWRASVVAVVALIVAIVVAAVLGCKEE